MPVKKDWLLLKRLSSLGRGHRQAAWCGELGGVLWMNYYMTSHCTHLIQAFIFLKQGILGSGFSCENWISPSRWASALLEENPSSVLAIKALDIFLDELPELHKCSMSQRGCDLSGGCWSDLSAEATGPESIEGHVLARPWRVLRILSFFVPFNFAVVHGRTSGLPRAASLISPAGLLPLEIMRAWTSYQLYQESFFPAKPVRALLSGNFGLKLLFSYFTDGLNEWFTRRVKD